MTIEFHTDPDLSETRCTEMEDYAPTNPFYTRSYIEARRQLGAQPWVLSIRQSGIQVSACTAFMTFGRLNIGFEITSLPILPNAEVFWKGLLRFCREVRISHLEINSFASPGAKLPTLPGEMARRARNEYVLELKNPDLWAELSSNHARNIKRARNACLHMRRAVDPQACEEHARLVGASIERRTRRNEAIAVGGANQGFATLIQTGAGELFQVVLKGKVLASVLIVMAKQGAYYQSAGTSHEGMACGASHFLVFEIAEALKKQSMWLLNLGGVAQENPGLERFKAGFGATRIELESAEFFLGSKLKRQLSTVIGMLQEKPLQYMEQIRKRLLTSASPSQS